MNIKVDDFVEYLCRKACGFSDEWHSRRRLSKYQYPEKLPSLSDWMEQFVTFLEYEEDDKAE